MGRAASMLGCLVALTLVGGAGSFLAAGQKPSLCLGGGLVILHQALAGQPADPTALAPVQPTAPEPTDADGFPLEPPLVPVSIWGDLAPLGNTTGDASAGQGSVGRSMARARAVYDPGRCPDDGLWCLDCPGDRGPEPAALALPVPPDWSRFGPALGTTALAEAHLAKAKALAERVDHAFCRLVKRYHHPVPRHRKRFLTRSMDDAMYLYFQMVQEHRTNLRIRATFRAKLAEPGWEESGEPGVLPLKERLAYVDAALRAIQATQDTYLEARLPKVDARLQGREEEAIWIEPEAKPKGKTKAGKKPRRLRGE